ncbi:PIN domain-containing protein [Methyloprofundus sp.]|uniref:PIN domain-containing protein n=1 Tax=Methyloprofundus sp. TaxID=2020875 RepID=UPI003D0C029C
MSGSFLDSNIVIYSLGNIEEKRQRSIELISGHPFISVQVLNETANILIRKFLMPVNDIQVIMKRIASECKVTLLTEEIHFSALSVKERYQFSFYDSLIVASALEASCDILYSEDMQHGQIIENRLKIASPFEVI